MEIADVPIGDPHIVNARGNLQRAHRVSLLPVCSAPSIAKAER
jgi:hypothetical protein